MEAPYGSWTSPIDARRIAEGGVGLGWPQAVGEAAYWVEMRPTEGGRYVVVRRDPGGAVADVTPIGVNARTLVHEYGGGMYVPFRNESGGESVVFSDYADQRLYRQDLEPAETARDARVTGRDGGVAGRNTGQAGAAGGGGPAGWSAPRPITPAPPAPRAWRYADADVTADGRLLVCVRERHTDEGVVNDLVALPTDGASAPVVVAEGRDFFAGPRLSAGGTRVAWLSWDQPRMPWDGTELWSAEVDEEGRRRVAARLAGRETESVVQPRWTPQGDLLFVSDREGWWNLYRLEAAVVDEALRRAATGGESSAIDAVAGSAAAPALVALAPLEAEFAKPHWVFGLRNYDLLPCGDVVASFTRGGIDHLGIVAEGDVRDIAVDAMVFSSLVACGDRILAVVAAPNRSWEVVLLDPRSGDTEVLRRGRDDEFDPRYVSLPEAIEFPTWYEPGTVKGPLAGEAARARDVGHSLTAHALYYPPTNPDFTAPAGEKPPLLVLSHGGPTSAVETGLSLDTQYWTSRGFAVVAVNYGGSSGYGRAYRERLNGNWGVVDTVDCIRAAEFLVARGDVDPLRLAVRGGSAGGYTTLNALTRFDTFAAGASHFGLADLERFVAGGTHKFEERYLFQLIGPYPEAAQTYRERSPIHRVDDISCAVLLLQGLEDAIVPAEQAEIIVAALRRRGQPHAYVAFEGEQHGFRKAESIVRSLEVELSFYGTVFGFTPADEIEPLAIEGLPV